MFPRVTVDSSINTYIFCSELHVFVGPFAFNSCRPSDVYICVSKLTTIGSDNGLPPGRHQAIIWTNAVLVSIVPLVTNLSKIFIKIHTFSIKRIHIEMSSGKWRPFLLGRNVLTPIFFFIEVHLFVGRFAFKPVRQILPEKITFSEQMPIPLTFFACNSTSTHNSIRLLVVIWLQKLAQLSCHAQNFAAITSVEYQWKQNEISTEFELWWENR